MSSAITGKVGRRSVTLGHPVFLEPPVLPFVAFLAFIVFRYLQGSARIPVLGEIRFELIAGGLLCGIALMLPKYSEVKGSDDFLDGRILGWGVALLALMLLMVPFSVVPAVSWEVFVDRALKMALIGFLVSRFVTSPRSLAWFMGAYLLAFMKMAQEGVTGYVTGSLVWENQGTPRLHGPTPSYMHPNSFAGTQLGTLPFLLAIRSILPGRWRLLVVVQFLAATLIVVACGSRTAYVALLGWVAYHVGMSKQKLKAAIVVIILGMSAPILVPPAYLERFGTIFTQEDKEGQSILARKTILSDAWAIFVRHPLGVGVGAFPAVRNATFGRQQDTHNLYLEVGTNLGVLGLVVFGAFVYSMYRTLVRVRRRALDLLDRLRQQGAGVEEGPQERELRWGLRLVNAVSSALIGFLTIRLFLGLFGHDLYEVYWWFAAGLTVSMAKIVRAASAHLVDRKADRKADRKFKPRRSQPVDAT